MMNTEFQPHLKWLLLIVVTGLFWQACGSSNLEKSIAQLEKKFQDATSSPNQQNSEEVNAIRQELAQKYEQYADENKDSEQAPERLYLAAEIYESNLVDPSRAIVVLDRIIQDYPQHDRAANALFKKGFIYNNNPRLQDLTKAKASYQEFIQKYPDHQLRDDAEFEINNLGVPTEQLLERIRIDSSGTDTSAGSPS